MWRPRWGRYCYEMAMRSLFVLIGGIGSLVIAACTLLPNYTVDESSRRADAALVDPVMTAKQHHEVTANPQGEATPAARPSAFPTADAFATSPIVATDEQEITTCTLPQIPYSGPLSPLQVGLDIPFDVDIIQNEGQVCFRPSADHRAADLRTRLLVDVISSGCYSSSCTLAYERNAEMQIDLEQQRIRFLSRFMVKDYSGVPGPAGEVCECTADCGGAGMIEFDTGELPAGVYQIELGTKVIGEISIPFYHSSKCLSTE